MSEAAEVETRRGRPDFLKMVGDLAVLARGGIENLRTNIHPASYSFRDTLPETVPDNEAAALEDAVRTYLGEMKTEDTALKELNKGTNGIKPSDPISRNTAMYDPEARAWQTYYKRLGVVEWQCGLFQRDTDERLGSTLDAIVNGISEWEHGSQRDLAQFERRQKDILKRRIARKLGDKFFGLMDEIQQEIYAGLPSTIREDPGYLYGLCFNVLSGIEFVNLRGKVLERKLDEEGIPVELFEEYTGRNLNEEEQAKQPVVVRPEPVVPATEVIQPVRTPIIGGGRPNGYADPEDAVDAAVRIANGERPAPATEGSIVLPIGYEVVSGNTWSLGNAELRRRCTADPNTSDSHRSEGGLYVPLRFKENLDFRLSHPNENGVWDTWLDSRAGVVRYDVVPRTGPRIKMAKVVPNCEPLINLPGDFNRLYLEGDELRDLPGVEINLGDVKHNRDLSQEEVPDNQLWLAAVEGGSDLLQRYANLAFTRFSGGGMGFYVNTSDLTTTQLRPLYVYFTDFRSIAIGGNCISDDGRFLRVCPAPQR